MPRKPSKRVVYNRSVADALLLGVADGLLAVADEIIATAQPDVPDAEPFGRGLVTTGGTVAYLDGKKVGGAATKPRSARIPKSGIAAFAGYGFPARFQELGTVNHPPQPFATPAMNRVVVNAEQHIKPKVAARLRGVR
jgi:hypothetical protein